MLRLGLIALIGCCTLGCAETIASGTNAALGAGPTQPVLNNARTQQEGSWLRDDAPESPRARSHCLPGVVRSGGPVGVPLGGVRAHVTVLRGPQRAPVLERELRSDADGRVRICFPKDDPLARSLFGEGGADQHAFLRVDFSQPGYADHALIWDVSCAAGRTLAADLQLGGASCTTLDAVLRRDDPRFRR